MIFEQKYRLLVMQALNYIVLFYPKYNLYHAFEHKKALDKEIERHSSHLGMIIADIHYGTLEPLIDSAIRFYPLGTIYDNQYLEPYRSVAHAKRIFKSNKAENDDVIKIDKANDVSWDDFSLVGSVTMNCEYDTRPPTEDVKNTDKNVYIFV